MKRLCLLVVCLVFCFCTACSFKSYKKPITEDFVCNFTATYNQMQLAGEIQRGDKGSLVMTLTKPATLSGLVCQVQDGELTLKLGELVYKTMVIPEAAVPRFLQEVLDVVTSASWDRDAQVYTGTAGTRSFAVTVDANTGFIQTVSLPDATLEIQFSEVKKTES